MNKLNPRPRIDEAMYNAARYAQDYGKPSGKNHPFHPLNLVEEQHRSELHDLLVFHGIPLRAWIPYPQAFAHLGPEILDEAHTLWAKSFPAHNFEYNESLKRNKKNKTTGKPDNAHGLALIPLIDRERPSTICFRPEHAHFLEPVTADSLSYDTLCIQQDPDISLAEWVELDKKPFNASYPISSAPKPRSKPPMSKSRSQLPLRAKHPLSSSSSSTHVVPVSSSSSSSLNPKAKVFKTVSSVPAVPAVATTQVEIGRAHV
jgi:hypothetical protein